MAESQDILAPELQPLIDSQQSETPRTITTQVLSERHLLSLAMSTAAPTTSITWCSSLNLHRSRMLADSEYFFAQINSAKLVYTVSFNTSES